MSLKFENASLDDFDRLVPLVSAFYQFLALEKKQAPDSKQEQARQKRYLKRYLSEANCNYIVCRQDNNQLLGYSFISIELRNKRVAYINELFVAETARGKHIGSSLIAESIKWLKQRGCESINLTVNQTNHNALSLYSRTGFQRQQQDYVDMILQV